MANCWRMREAIGAAGPLLILGRNLGRHALRFHRSRLPSYVVSVRDFGAELHFAGLDYATRVHK